MTNRAEEMASSETQRVERLLQQAAAWEPNTSAPDDLCVRVAERITGRTARQRPVGRQAAFAPFALATSAAFVFAAFALIVPSLIPQNIPAGGTASPAPVVAGEWSPPRLARPVTKGGASSGMNLAVFTQQEPASQVAQVEPASTGTKKKPNPAITPRLKRAFPKIRRAERWYASRQRHRNRVPSTTQPVGPETSSGEWQSSEGELVAYIPVVLAEYEAEPADGDNPGGVQEILTPAIVAVSLKPDSFNSTSGSSEPKTIPSPEPGPAPEIMPTPETSPSPETVLSPTPK